MSEYDDVVDEVEIFMDPSPRRDVPSNMLFDFETQESDVPYYQQGDPRFNKQDAMDEREFIKEDEQMKNYILKFWKIAMQSSEDGCMNKEQYMDFMRKACKLLRTDKVWDLTSITEQIEEDWISDCKGFDNLTRERFYDAIFELIDYWTTSIDILEYYEFAIKLYNRITVKIIKYSDGTICYITPWKKCNLTDEIIRRLPVSLLEKLGLIREIVEETTDGLTLGDIQDGGEELLNQIKQEYLDNSIIDDGTNNNTANTPQPNTPSRPGTVDDGSQSQTPIGGMKRNISLDKFKRIKGMNGKEMLEQVNAVIDDLHNNPEQLTLYIDKEYDKFADDKDVELGGIDNELTPNERDDLDQIDQGTPAHQINYLERLGRLKRKGKGKGKGGKGNHHHKKKKRDANGNLISGSESEGENSNSENEGDNSNNKDKRNKKSKTNKNHPKDRKSQLIRSSRNSKAFTHRRSSVIRKKFVELPEDKTVCDTKVIEKNGLIIETTTLENGHKEQIITKDSDGNILDQLIAEYLSKYKKKITRLDKDGNAIDEYIVEKLKDGSEKIIRVGKDGVKIEEIKLADGKTKIIRYDKDGNKQDEFICSNKVEKYKDDGSKAIEYELDEFHKKVYIFDENGSYVDDYTIELPGAPNPQIMQSIYDNGSDDDDDESDSEEEEEEEELEKIKEEVEEEGKNDNDNKRESEYNFINESKDNNNNNSMLETTPIRRVSGNNGGIDNTPITVNKSDRKSTSRQDINESKLENDNIKSLKDEKNISTPLPNNNNNNNVNESFETPQTIAKNNSNIAVSPINTLRNNNENNDQENKNKKNYVIPMLKLPENENPENCLYKKQKDGTVIKELDLENGYKHFTQYDENGKVIDSFTADKKTTRYKEDGTKLEEYNVDDSKTKVILHNRNGAKLDDYTIEKTEDGKDKITRLDLNGNKNQEVINEDGQIDVCRTDRSGYVYDQFSARSKKVDYHEDGAKREEFDIDNDHKRILVYDKKGRLVDDYEEDNSDKAERKIIRIDRDSNKTIETVLSDGRRHIQRFDKNDNLLDDFFAQDRIVEISNKNFRKEEYIINPSKKKVIIYDPDGYIVDQYEYETLPHHQDRIIRTDTNGIKTEITNYGNGTYKIVRYDKDGKILDEFIGENGVIKYDNDGHRIHTYVLDDTHKRVLIFDKNGNLVDDYVVEKTKDKSKKILRYDVEGNKFEFIMHGKGNFTINRFNNKGKFLSAIEARDKTIIYSKNGCRLEEYTIDPRIKKIFYFDKQNKIVDEYLSELMPDNKTRRITRVDKRGNRIELFMMDGRLFHMMKYNKVGTLIEEYNIQKARMHKDMENGTLIQDMLLENGRRKILKLNAAGHINDEYEIEDLPDGTFKIFRTDNDLGITTEEHNISDFKKHIVKYNDDGKVIDEYDIEIDLDENNNGGDNGNNNFERVKITKYDKDGNRIEEIQISENRKLIRIYNANGELIDEHEEEILTALQQLFAFKPKGRRKSYIPSAFSRANTNLDGLNINGKGNNDNRNSPTTLDEYRRAKSMIVFRSKPLIDGTGNLDSNIVSPNRNHIGRVRSARAKLHLSEKEKVNEWELFINKVLLTSKLNPQPPLQKQPYPPPRSDIMGNGGGGNNFISPRLGHGRISFHPISSIDLSLGNIDPQQQQGQYYHPSKLPPLQGISFLRGRSLRIPDKNKPINKHPKSADSPDILPNKKNFKLPSIYDIFNEPLPKLLQQQEMQQQSHIHTINLDFAPGMRRYSSIHVPYPAISKKTLIAKKERRKKRRKSKLGRVLRLPQINSVVLEMDSIYNRISPISSPKKRHKKVEKKEIHVAKVAPKFWR